MDPFSAGKSPKNSVGKIFRTAAFIFLFAAVPSGAGAAWFTVTEGIVERVSGPVVTVRGQNHDIGHARLQAPSGMELPPGELASGKKVALHIAKGKVVAVVIYPSMME